MIFRLDEPIYSFFNRAHTTWLEFPSKLECIVLTNKVTDDVLWWWKYFITTEWIWMEFRGYTYYREFGILTLKRCLTNSLPPTLISCIPTYAIFTLYEKRARLMFVVGIICKKAILAYCPYTVWLINLFPFKSFSVESACSGSIFHLSTVFLSS